MRLLICNRSTSAMGACFPMSLLSHRMCFVVLVDETLNVNHQLAARLPAVVRQRITAPANKVTRSLHLHVTVVQNTLHAKELTTVRIHQWLWWGREYQLRISWLLELQAEIGRLQQRVHDLCDRTERERQERLSLEAWVQRIRLYRLDDRSEFVLENERKH